MTVRIMAASHDEFNNTDSGVCYGLLQGRRGLYVYVQLGQEQEYKPGYKDDPKTEYKFFVGCDVFFAKTEAALRAGDFEAEFLPDVPVVIYS